MMKPQQNHGSPARGSHAKQVSAARFPALRALVRGYLHEDFEAEHGSAEAAVRAFRTDASPGQVRDVVREWQRFSALTASWTITDVRATLSRDLGAAWQPADRRELQHAFEPFSRRSA